MIRWITMLIETARPAPMGAAVRLPIHGPVFRFFSLFFSVGLLSGCALMNDILPEQGYTDYQRGFHVAEDLATDLVMNSQITQEATVALAFAASMPIAEGTDDQAEARLHAMELISLFNELLLVSSNQGSDKRAFAMMSRLGREMSGFIGSGFNRLGGDMYKHGESLSSALTKQSEALRRGDLNEAMAQISIAVLVVLELLEKDAGEMLKANRNAMKAVIERERVNMERLGERFGQLAGPYRLSDELAESYQRHNLLRERLLDIEGNQALASIHHPLEGNVPTPKGWPKIGPMALEILELISARVEDRLVAYERARRQMELQDKLVNQYKRVLSSLSWAFLALGDGYKTYGRGAADAFNQQVRALRMAYARLRAQPL